MIPQELKDAYVVSDDGSGNPVLMNKEGKIFFCMIHGKQNYYTTRFRKC
ncbi:MULTISPECIES: hypothetical protein [Lysinibacillus]|nr:MULTISPECIES: hypothetical protein [Lysinibacillus]